MRQTTAALGATGERPACRPGMLHPGLGLPCLAVAATLLAPLPERLRPPTGRTLVMLGTSQPNDMACAIAFSPDGRTLAWVARDSSIHLWDVATRKDRQVLRGHSGVLSDLTFSPDGRSLVTVGQDRTLRVWDAATGGLRRSTRHGFAYGHSVAYSPDGGKIVSQDRTLRVWDAASGKELHAYAASGDVWDAAFDPTGKRLAAGSREGLVKVWDVERQQCLRTLAGHGGIVTGVDFRSDGKLLASGSFDRLIKLWDPDTGREVRTLNGHEDRVTEVVFSPDDRLLASAGWDGQVRFWDPDSGRPLRVVKLLPGRPVYALAFSPDGKLLATANGDGTVHLLEVVP